MKLPSYVLYLDDERDIGNAIIVTLKEGYTFSDGDGCGVMGFDTMQDVRRALKRSNILVAEKSPAADGILSPV